MPPKKENPNQQKPTNLSLSIPKAIQPNELHSAIENAVSIAVSTRQAKRPILLYSCDLEFSDVVKDYLSELISDCRVELSNTEQINWTQLLYVRPLLVIYDHQPSQGKDELFTQQLRDEPEFQSIPIVFLISNEMAVTDIPGYRMEADASLFKPFDPDQLVVITKRLLKMEVWDENYSGRGRIIRGALTGNPQAQQPHPIIMDLTPREQQVLEYVVEGLMRQEIAVRLNTSPRYVKKYISRLFKKTGTSSLIELIRYYHSHQNV
jgi:DNA-binding NarL/FixJ family response regulator